MMADAEPRPRGSRSQSRLKLLQLVSPIFPVGAFAYSQGLEAAAASGWVLDEESLFIWVSGVMTRSVACLDLPMLRRSHAAWRCDDREGAIRLSEETLAFRESRELVEEDRHFGSALARILAELGSERARDFAGQPFASYPTLFALAAVDWELDLEAAAEAYLFAWAENQVSAASRLIPLGQIALQRSLSRLIRLIPEAAHHGLSLPDEAIGGLCPAHAMASAWHETQYSRLFRS